MGLIPPGVRPIVLPPQPLNLQGTNLVPLRLKCIELPAASCRGTVVITAPLALVYGDTRGRARLASARRRRVVGIARGKVVVPSGQTATSKLRLTGAASRALRRRGSLRVEVSASMTVGGEVRTSRRTLTLRAPRR